MVKSVAIFFLGTGFFILFQTISPLLNYQLWEIKFFNETNLLVSPQIQREQVLGISIQTDESSFPMIVSGAKREIKAPFRDFILSIPKLNVMETKVYVDSNDLQKGLAHLPGSGLPGEKGNVFISGHSALPQFFNGNKNYGSIFANLNKLTKGDEIKLKALDIEFTYRVEQIKIVSPKDLSVIDAPDKSGRFVSLMTCVPPGLNTKRLVVIGKLI